MPDDDRISKLEEAVHEHHDALIVLSERQEQMHKDLENNTEAVKELTKALVPINAFINNNKTVAKTLTAVFTALVALSGAIAWVIDRFLSHSA